MGQKNAAEKTVCENRKARHDYFIHETYEAGIELFGTEVKSLRAGRVNLKDAYGVVKNGELRIENMHISPYEQGNIFNTDPLRPKRLLLHKSEIRKLGGQVQRQGYALVPLDVYLKDGRMKMSLGLCVGKHLHDKRASTAERDVKREMARMVRTNNRGE